jgi:hypothetical protein
MAKKSKSKAKSAKPKKKKTIKATGNTARTAIISDKTTVNPKDEP